MTIRKNWLTTGYTGLAYKLGFDVDSEMEKRRKALDEINDILRQKWLHQIDIAMKQD